MKKRSAIIKEREMTPPGSKKKVLIVESDDVIAQFFQRELRDAGFDARTTWSGHEALALVQCSEFDVLLTDSYLPDLHATDFLERVSRLLSQPRVVVMRDGLSSEPLRRYRRLGASGVVDKRDAARVVQAVSAGCAADPLAKASSH
jgi:DNA-binding response OmpR family regulator